MFFIVEYQQSSKLITCIEHQENDFEQLPIRFINETGTCLVKNFNKALDSLEVIVKEVNQTESQVKIVTNEFYKCNNSPQIQVCVIKVSDNFVRCT